jgi:hypothetical protein
MFTLRSFFNPHLPVGQTRLDVVLTVVSDNSAAAAGAGVRRVVGFVVDTSGSMDGDKLAQAKLAARRGIDQLAPTDWFFVVVFNAGAEALVTACQASAAQKSRAHAAIQRLQAQGGTAMSTGLVCALQQVRQSGCPLASVYFLTDGDNDNGDDAPLHRVVELCRGVFQCDCRGVGTDWKPKELKFIADTLLGTADAIVDPAGLEEDFRVFLARSLSKGISGARLRLWSPKVVKLTTVKQVSPDIVDLIPQCQRIDEKTVEVALGAWGQETRDYQLAFELPLGVLDDEVLACRVSIVFEGAAGETVVAGEPIAARWSNDDNLTARISREVAHYNGQGELAQAIQEGLGARAAGDEDRATRLLGRAAQLAVSSGNEEVTRRLKKVVDVVDAAAGTVRLRKADKGAAMELELGATRTVRRARAAAPGPANG